VEAGGDAAQAEAEAGLGRALRDAGELGDLAEGPALEVGEQDGGALGVRELVDGHPDPLGHGGGHGGLLGVGRGRRLALDGRPGRVPLADAGPAEVVDGAVVGHGGQPGAQPAPVGIEGRRPLPEVEEHLLGDVLGGRAVAGDPDGQAVDHGRELVVGLGQGQLVTGPQAGAQLPFPIGEPRRLALHRACSLAARDVPTPRSPQGRHRFSRSRGWPRPAAGRRPGRGRRSRWRPPSPGRGGCPSGRRTRPPGW
jgi:hypothetical protein